MSNWRSLAIFICAIAVFSFYGCAAVQPNAKPADIVPPEPIANNSGKYMCPYTQDDVVAPWCDKAINASVGATVGETAGAMAGAKALENVPFVGGFLGAQAGEMVGRKIAIEASGGMEYIKETSDLSFDTAEDLAVWLYATKSSNEHYADVIKATGDIYPEFNSVFNTAIRNAPRRQ